MDAVTSTTTRRCTLLLRLGAVVVLAATVGAGMATPQPSLSRPAGRGVDLGRVSWQSLTFQASKFFLTATTRVRLEVVPAVEVAPRLIAAPRGEPVRAGSPALVAVELETRFLKRRSVEVSWLDPRTAAALQIDKVEHRKRSAYRKTFRFTDQGVFSHRESPGEDQPLDLDPEEWSKEKETFYSFDGTHPPWTVSSGAALFYLAAAVPLEEGTEVSVLVFADKRLVPVVMRADGLEQIDAVYRTAEGDRIEEHRGPVVARRVRVTSADPERDGFGLLGLQGDLTFYLDPERGIPLRVSGRAKVVGHLDVDLTDAVLGSPGPASRAR